MQVYSACRIILRPADRSTGHIVEADLTPGTFGGLGWPATTPPGERRVILDLRYCTGFGAGVAEKISRVLADAGAGPIQVESDRRSGMRNAFASQLLESNAAYEPEARR